MSPQVTGLEHTDYPRPDGVYYYSAASVDAAGNYSVLSNVAAAVTDSSAPSAEISLPGVQPPLGAGTYRVELEVSEVLSVSPYLVFTPPLAGPIVLPLEPETPYLWAGTFTVTAAMRSGTGYFSYEGVDLAGNKGGEMTSGGTLELDTAGPEASLVFEPEAGPALKADAYPLLLTLSRPSAAAPELHYSVAGGTSAVALSSSSSASEWSGLLGVDSGTGEGAHYFLFSARDTLGNTGTLLTGATYFIADTLAPGAPLSPNWANGPGGRVDLSWSAPAGERPSAYRLYRDGEPLSAAVAPDPEYHSGSYSEVPPPGARVYRIAAVDAAGNEGPLSDPVETLSDGEPPPPPAELSVSADGALVQLAWTAGQGEPAVSFRLYRSTSPISSAAGLSGRALIGAAASDAPGRDGVYYYALSAVDAAGNESAPAAAEPLAYDGAAPEITITGAEDGVHYNAPVRPQVGIYDLAPDQAGILLDGSVFVPGALVASEGSHTLLVNASDASGNSSSATVVFVVDLTTPVITVGGVSQGGSYVSAVTPAVSASDAYLSSVTALLNGAAYPIGESITAGGAYTLEVTARDFAGNSSAYSVSFELDPPPPGPAGLSAVIEDGSALALAWEPIPGAALYKVYRDGVYLSPASSASFRDTGYAAGTAAVYEVAGIDGKGREGGRARAELPALRFSLAGYGNYAGSAQALNRGFFDTVRFTVENGGGLPLAAGPLTLSSAGGAAAPAPAATVPAGGSAELSAVVYTAASSSAAAAARAELALPPAGDAALKAVLNFSMSSREPVQPVVELYPEALVRGAYAKAKLKFNNRGSAPADVVTAVVSNYAARPSTAAALALRTPAGFTLSRAELLQASRDVNAAFLDGAQVYYVRVPPGSSYLFDPVELAVPLSAEGELLLAGGVYSMHYALDRTPLSAEPAFEAVLPQSAAAVIPYTAFASPSKEVYDKGEPVVISGYALDPATGLRPGGKAVLLTVSNRGFERAVGVTTAQDGSFVHVSTPTAGEAGIYYVTASYPYAVSRLAQSSYSITGFEPGYTDYTARLAQNSSYTFDVPLHNTGETVLTGLEASFTQDSGTGVAVSAADPPSEIQPGERKNLSVTLSAAPDASPAAS
ncbi:MAG TPA: hypothetical protein PKK31_04715, partial [Elusimicrobiales bacterium]|nr:hypothetical protein [Elusimicrobiales bacterium]